MAFKLPRNSLFAILLRSPWWVSFAIAGVLSLVAMALLPAAYRVVGALSSFPFIVIGILALKRQWNLPGAREIEQTAEHLGQLNWQAFAPLAESALAAPGRVIQAYRGAAADFELHDGQGRMLVSSRRWKSARLGIEPLQALQQACAQSGARGGIVMCLGEITEPARRFAADRSIEIWGAPELALRLRGRLTG